MSRVVSPEKSGGHICVMITTKKKKRTKTKMVRLEHMFLYETFKCRI